MRDVTGTIVRPDGSPVAYTVVEFLLCDPFGRIVDAYDDQRRIASAAKTMTDENGRFSISVTENSVIKKHTAYKVRVNDPGMRDFIIYVNAGTTVIDIVDLVRYGQLNATNFAGVIYDSRVSIDGAVYRYRCDMVELVLNYIDGRRSENIGSVIPTFAELFIAHEDGYWSREDMGAFDALLADMVERKSDCVTIQGE